MEQVTPDGLRHFYDTFYWPNNATLSIIGDIDKAVALQLVEERFGAIKPSPEPIPDVTTREPAQRGERRVTVRQAGQLGVVLVAYKVPPALDPDAEALDVLATVLASGMSSRLYRRLTDEGITTSVHASGSHLRNPGLFSCFAMLAPERTHEEVEAAIYEEIRLLREKGITDEELSRAKNQLRALEAFSRDGSFAIAAQLNEAIAAGDWKLYTTFRERLDRVTAADVQRVAQTYLVEDARTVGFYVPVQEREKG